MLNFYPVWSNFFFKHASEHHLENCIHASLLLLKWKLNISAQRLMKEKYQTKKNHYKNSWTHRGVEIKKRRKPARHRGTCRVEVFNLVSPRNVKTYDLWRFCHVLAIFSKVLIKLSPSNWCTFLCLIFPFLVPIGFLFTRLVSTQSL